MLYWTISLRCREPDRCCFRVGWLPLLVRLRTAQPSVQLPVQSDFFKFHQDRLKQTNSGNPAKRQNSKSRLKYWSFSCFRWFCFNECQHLKTPQWGWILTKLSDVFWMLTLTLFNQEVTLKPRFRIQVEPEYRMKLNKTKLIIQNMVILLLVIQNYDNEIREVLNI